MTWQPSKYTVKPHTDPKKAHMCLLTVELTHSDGRTFTETVETVWTDAKYAANVSNVRIANLEARDAVGTSKDIPAADVVAELAKITAPNPARDFAIAAQQHKNLIEAKALGYSVAQADIDAALARANALYDPSYIVTVVK